MIDFEQRQRFNEEQKKRHSNKSLLAQLSNLKGAQQFIYRGLFALLKALSSVAPVLAVVTSPSLIFCLGPINRHIVVAAAFAARLLADTGDVTDGVSSKVQGHLRLSHTSYCAGAYIIRHTG